MAFLESHHGQIAVRLAGWLGMLLLTSMSLAEGLPDVSARPPWTLLSQSDDSRTGYILHRRKTENSDAATFRLEAIVDSPPELVANAARKYLTEPKYRPENTDKEILQNDDEAIVVYNYIRINAPFVSDRDIISRIKPSYDPTSRTHRLEWKAISEGPPKKDGVVRLEHSEGSWTFTPEADGTTRAVYLSRTDSAGYVPAWIVNAQMSRTMVDGIKGLRQAVESERQTQ